MIRLITGTDKAGKAAFDLAGAYLVGADGVPVRGDIEPENDLIVCKKRSAGPVGLSLVHDAGRSGRLMLETTRLIERDRPYVLSVELARGRLMRISQKREDWGLFDYPGGDELYAKVDEAKDHFIRSLTAADEGKMVEEGQKALAMAVEVGEGLSAFHATVFLERRRTSQQFGPRTLGCGISLSQRDDTYRSRALEAFDFASVQIPWRLIEPKQGTVVWDAVDPQIAWASKNKLALRVAPLVSFDPAHLPDWAFLYEQDFDTVRDLLAGHIKRTVQRLGPYVHCWEVVSGLHATNTFHFNLEQMIELTRASAGLVKQISPRSTAILNLTAPWGEYYARNPRTVPPMMFADMAVQSGIPFDALGLEFYFGIPQDGMFVRDLMQVSSLVDKFANLGKPMHITAVQVPSAHAPDPGDAWKGTLPPAAAGRWHGPWSEDLQSEWVRQFCEVVLSKPFVETVAWRDLADTDGHYLPHGGLLRVDLTPKPAYDRFLVMRSEWLPGRTNKRK